MLAVALLITGLHVAQMWHSDLAGCMKHNTCGNLSLNSPTLTTLVVGTSAVPLLPGLFWGAPMVAHELETGTNQFAWTQSITRRHWLVVRTGWLLLAAAVLAGAVSALVTWWSGPDNALYANAFEANKFDVTDIVPAGTRSSRWPSASAPAHCCAAPCPRWSRAEALRLVGQEGVVVVAGLVEYGDC